MVLLGGLLFLALRQFSPLTVAANYDTFPLGLRVPDPALAALGLGAPPAGLVHALHAVCLVAWVFALAGLLTGPALLVTALTAALLHGIGRSMIDAHGWIVPVATLLALNASSPGDTWSLDALIRRRWPAWPGAARPGSIRASGLARKVVLLVCVHTLFAGGVAKLLGGWGWADGQSLRYYIEASPDLYAQPPRFPWLFAWLQEHGWSFSVMAAMSLVMELASPIALFSRTFRHLLVAVAVVFHAGVYLIMLPDFSAQALCYVLLIDWGRVAGAVRQGIARVPTVITLNSIGAAAAATALAIALLGAIASRRDRWLLTNVPMYSSAVTPLVVAGVARSDYDTRQGLTRLAAMAEPPWASKWLFWPRTDIVLEGAAGTESIKSALFTYRYRWVQMLGELVHQEARRALLGDQRAPRLDAGAVLQVAVDQARRDGMDTGRYRTVQLVYRADDGPVVLSRGEIRPPPPPRGRASLSPRR